jgi:hypothetical protein
VFFIFNYLHCEQKQSPKVPVSGLFLMIPPGNAGIVLKKHKRSRPSGEDQLINSI